MRLVHLSDLHLGYRQYLRTTPAGVNQREADVAGTFHRVIDRVIALAPNLVVIGGDIFHTTRPTNAAIVATFGEFARLVAALNETAIVLVGGNHDMPKVSDGGCILDLFRHLGIHVAAHASQRIDLPDLDCSVLAVPDTPCIARPALEPNPAARFNVLVMHGSVHGMPSAVKEDRPGVEISESELPAAAWDYIALGHYHVYHELAPNMFYSGSIDYTSTDTWSERAQETKLGLAGKGIIERDLETGAHTVHPLPPSRPFIDLPAIDAAGLSATEVDAAIAGVINASPINVAGSVARLVVHQLPKDVSKLLDQKALRSFRASALHLHLDFRQPDVVRLGSIIGPALMRGLPLDCMVADRIRKRELVDTSLNRDDVAAMASKYLEEARVKNEPVADTAPMLELSERAS